MPPRLGCRKFTWLLIKDSHLLNARAKLQRGAGASVNKKAGVTTKHKAYTCLWLSTSTSVGSMTSADGWDTVEDAKMVVTDIAVLSKKEKAPSEYAVVSTGIVEKLEVNFT